MRCGPHGLFIGAFVAAMTDDCIFWCWRQHVIGKGIVRSSLTSHRFGPGFAVVVAIAMTLTGVRAEEVKFEEGERVVFIGNTFAERMQYYGYFEALLQYRMAGRGVVLRNMGWSADEVGLMPRPLNFEGGAGDLYANDTNVGYDVQPSTEVDFKMLKAHLTARRADTILLCFGANEAFQGEGGLGAFVEDYQTLIDELLSEKFNGKSPPRLILVSPIPQENLGVPYSDPRQRNESLAVYSETVRELAEASKLVFADLFEATRKLMEDRGDEALTIDGLQLNATGQRAVAEVFMERLGMTTEWLEAFEPLRLLVVEKDRNFFQRWRPINGEYVFGRRKEPFGVLTFPPEMIQLEEIVADLDREIQKEAKKLGSPE